MSHLQHHAATRNAHVGTIPADTCDRRDRPLRDRGQATTEYALVLLAGALVGLLVIGWATGGGGAAAVARLFQRVIQSVIERV
jgi:hypothetical protein